MITFFLGLPGSGKTNFAVDRIFNNFSLDEEAKKDKKVTFKNCYTNINEFKFDKVVNVFNLDFDELYKILTEAHGYYKAKKSDEFLVEFMESKNLKDTLFVIDEAHNYFDKKDLILVWWLSYHRHLFHEIILITQNLALIESKYKSFSEFFYKAHAQSLTLDKRYFKYTIYCSSRLTAASKSGTLKIKRNPKVFALYKSGDSINAKNVVLKFVLISLAIFVFLLIFVRVFVLHKDLIPSSDSPGPVQLSLPSSAPANQISQSVVPQTTALQVEQSNNNFTNQTFITLSCALNKCSNESISIPPALLSVFIDNKSFTVLHSQYVNSKLTIFYLQSSTDFYNFLIPKKEEKFNELPKENKHINFNDIVNGGVASERK